MKDGPHCITWTHAEEVNAELLSFLGEKTGNRAEGSCLSSRPTDCSSNAKSSLRRTHMKFTTLFYADKARTVTCLRKRPTTTSRSHLFAGRAGNSKHRLGPGAASPAAFRCSGKGPVFYRQFARRCDAFRRRPRYGHAAPCNLQADTVGFEPCHLKLLCRRGIRAAGGRHRTREAGHHLSQGTARGGGR